MSIQDDFRRHGFVVIPNILAGHDLEALRAAAARLVARCRAGEHAWVRRSPSREDLWGVGKMFQPTSFEPELIEAMCVPAILAANEAIIGPSRLAVVSFLFNPEREDWDGPWHRDSQYLLPHQHERQRELVTAPTWSVQWNVALYDDDALEVVPGSLERWNTPEEQAVIDGGPGPMPGAETVNLRAGDGVIYTPLLVHRGRYRSGSPRATLHFAYNRRQETDARIPPMAPDVPPEALARLSPQAFAALNMAAAPVPDEG